MIVRYKQGGTPPKGNNTDEQSRELTIPVDVLPFPIPGVNVEKEAAHAGLTGRVRLTA